MIFGLTLFTTISCLILSVLFFRHHAPRSPFRSLGFLSLCLASWSLTNWLSLQPLPTEEKFFWIKVVMAVTIPIPWLFFDFTRSFGLKKYGVNRVMGGLLIWTGLLMILSFTPWMFQSYTVSQGRPQLIANWGVAAYGVTFLGLSFASTWVLFQTYLLQRGLARLQSAYILLGLSLTVLTGFMANFVLVAMFNRFELVALGPSSSLFLIGAITYAMLRHRLLDLRLAVIRFIAYLSTLLVITAVYCLGMSDLLHRLISHFSPISEQVIFMTSTVGALITFPYMLRFIQKVTRQLFYRTAFQAESAHQILSHIIGNTTSLKTLCTEIDRFFCTQLNVEQVTVVRGAEEHEQLQESLQSFFDQNNSLLVGDEIADEGLKKTLERKNISVVIPLCRVGKRLGWVYLGFKHSGDAFSADELRFCEAVGPQIALAIDHLNQVDQMKDDFVSIASHELRTPMTAIKSYLWLCLYRPSMVLPDAVREHIHIAYSATERLLELVKDLLTLSQLESQHLPLKKETVSLCALVEKVIGELSTLADNKHVHFVVKKVADDSSCIVDECKVMNILQNLLGNAIKFSPMGGTIEVTIGSDQYQVMVNVKDEGPGISDEDQQRLFQKFGVIQHSYRKSPETGTGLGLYISQQFANLHQGFITVKSTLGMGSTFTLCLPRQLSSYAKTLNPAY